ncbi:hypothetical protein AX774_g4295 [Zancudomyces culisetae]|uniref:Uncharacterized protein n=1 Tax=Zancudomyces culisetae TaxID=1213189 RepID=A0A1R1PK02_ZANCU|nr:hypothetical protein AX774_g5240 [Zancudomyces culisetae]OMH82224.1 hypothetical protein AX774_g4295 [Zancudomyces culisetae]|eukprot:OMH81296.1 hypothetical protein AX774_g5240 [Zancudomyces culisetae]
MSFCLHYLLFSTALHNVQTLITLYPLLLSPSTHSAVSITLTLYFLIVWIYVFGLSSITEETQTDSTPTYTPTNSPSINPTLCRVSILVIITPPFPRTVRFHTEHCAIKLPCVTTTPLSWPLFVLVYSIYAASPDAKSRKSNSSIIFTSLLLDKLSSPDPLSSILSVHSHGISFGQSSTPLSALCKSLLNALIFKLVVRIILLPVVRNKCATSS